MAMGNAVFALLVQLLFQYALLNPSEQAMLSPPGHHSLIHPQASRLKAPAKGAILCRASRSLWLHKAYRKLAENLQKACRMSVQLKMYLLGHDDTTKNPREGTNRCCVVKCVSLIET